MIFFERNNVQTKKNALAKNIMDVVNNPLFKKTKQNHLLYFF